MSNPIKIGIPVGAGKTQLIEKWLNALRKNYWRYY